MQPQDKGLQIISHIRRLCCKATFLHRAYKFLAFRSGMTKNASGGSYRLNLCITWRDCQQSIRIVQSSLHLPVMKRMLQYEVICPTNLTQFSLTAAPDRLQCCHLEAACANCNRKGRNLQPFIFLAGRVKKQNATV